MDAQAVKQRDKIRELFKLLDSRDTMAGVLGAKCGIRAESSFHNDLIELMEKNFDVTVLNINEFDDQGEVYGRPDQVELDIIIINGILIICEINFSLSKSDMYFFHKKAQFCEKRYNRTVKHLIAISSMVDEKAREMARDLGIKVYSCADEIPLELLT